MIMQYLVNEYDLEHNISSVGQDKCLKLQLLMLQIFGQGFVLSCLLVPEGESTTHKNFT